MPGDLVVNTSIPHGGHLISMLMTLLPRYAMPNSIRVFLEADMEFEADNMWIGLPALIRLESREAQFQILQEPLCLWMIRDIIRPYVLSSLSLETWGNCLTWAFHRVTDSTLASELLSHCPIGIARMAWIQSLDRVASESIGDIPSPEFTQVCQCFPRVIKQP